MNPSSAQKESVRRVNSESIADQCQNYDSLVNPNYCICVGHKI